MPSQLHPLIQAGQVPIPGTEQETSRTILLAITAPTLVASSSASALLLVKFNTSTVKSVLLHALLKPHITSPTRPVTAQTLLSVTMLLHICFPMARAFPRVCTALCTQNLGIPAMEPSLKVSTKARRGLSRELMYI